MKKLIIFVLAFLSLVLISCNEGETAQEKELLSIEVSAPTGITVYIGQKYIPSSDIKIYAIYDNEKEDVTSLAKFLPVDTTTLGQKQVEIVYKEKTTHYTIEVIRSIPEYQYALRIKQYPTKRDYYVNDELNLEGIKLVMVQNETLETEIGLDLCTITMSLDGMMKQSLDETGEYQVLISLKHQEVIYKTTFTIQVVMTVIDGPKDILGLDLQKSKLTYWMYEIFDPSTLVLFIKDSESEHQSPIDTSLCTYTLFYENEEVRNLSFTKSGTYVLKIEFRTIQCFVNIEVKYREIQKKLVLDIEDVKTQYVVGEAFNSSGLLVKYYENDILKQYVSTQNCFYTFKLNGIEKDAFDVPGTYSILVEFNGVFEGYRVTVID